MSGTVVKHIFRFSEKRVAYLTYFQILIVGLFVMLVAVQAGKSFVLDELDFPVVAHATSQTLKPIYYRGELTPTHIGTYHPTLYINSLAVFVKVFGFSETSVRFFGAICALLSCLLLLGILRLLIKKNKIAEILLLGLFLLNPYTIANVTVPDIDTTVLPVVLLLFIYTSLKYVFQNRDMGTKAVWVLGLLFGFALWSKLTTPLIIPPFLACLAFITSKSYKKSLIFTLKVSGIGAVAFLSTYFLYCKVLGLSTTYTYTFLVASFTKGTSTDGPLVGAIKNLGNIRYFVYWLTLPLVALLGVSVFDVVLNKGKDEATRIKQLLIVMSLLVTAFYIALISPFGGFFKYPFPVFGLLILAIIFFYDRLFRDVKINFLYALLATFVGFLIEHALWGDSMFLHGRPFGYVPALAALVIVAFIILRLYRRPFIASMFVLSLFFCIGFGLSISRAQAISPYSTKYLYGQTGMEQAAAYLRSVTAPNEAIWSMKDIGYYVNNRYYESYSYYFDKSLQTDLISKLRGSKVRYYVVTTGIGQDNIDYYADIKTIMDTYAVREKQFGNFVIYKSKE